MSVPAHKGPVRLGEAKLGIDISIPPHGVRTGTWKGPHVASRVLGEEVFLEEEALVLGH